MIIPPEAYRLKDTTEAIRIWAKLCADGYECFSDETGKCPWQLGPGPRFHVDPADYAKCRTEEEFAALLGTAKAIALLKGED